MKGLNWSLLAALVVLLCHYTTAAPSLRVKRQDELTLDPINADVSILIGCLLQNPKRKKIIKKRQKKEASKEKIKKKLN